MKERIEDIEIITTITDIIMKNTMIKTMLKEKKEIEKGILIMKDKSNLKINKVNLQAQVTVNQGQVLQALALMISNKILKNEYLNYKL